MSPRPAEAGGAASYGESGGIITPTAVGFPDALPTIPIWGTEFRTHPHGAGATCYKAENMWGVLFDGEMHHVPPAGKPYV